MPPTTPPGGPGARAMKPRPQLTRPAIGENFDGFGDVHVIMMSALSLTFK